MAQTRASRGVSAEIDSAVIFCLAIGAVVWAADGGPLPAELHKILALHITLLNACFAAAFAFLWRQCLTVLGLYRRDLTGFNRLVVRTAGASVVMTTVLALYLSIRHFHGPIDKVLLVFLLASFIHECGRVFVISRHLGWHVGERERVIILGSGPRASKAWRELRIQCHRTKHVLGFVDDRNPGAMPPDITSRFLGTVDDLASYLLHNAVDEMIVATPIRSCYDTTQRAVSIAEAAGVRVVFLNDVYTLSHERNLRERATLFLELVPKDEQRERAETAKRILDVVGAGIGLLLLSPLFLVIALAVKVSSPGPAFFVQERYGYRRRRFRMWKFRSMVQNAPALMQNLEAQNEANGPIFKMANDPRITRLGKFLRQTSLDELPQLWNVLLGDMSLVGPRPMSVRDVSLFSETQLMRRFSVRPGMTGIWQVAARSSLNFEQWIALDFSYIEHWSFLLDLKILAMTLPAVMKRSGAM
jgi:exopolysaccharide biosynthesis polyprenyl glycosylphosphotransferase